MTTEVGEPAKKKGPARATAKAAVTAKAKPKKGPTRAPKGPPKAKGPPTPGNVSSDGGPFAFALDDLVLDPRYQCRVKIDDETVASYAEAMLDPEARPFPPITVFDVGGDARRLCVVDGWHRVAAARRAGLTTIMGELEVGVSHRDAVIYSAKVNSTHGLPRSRADKRRAVCMLLRDLVCCCLSSRELAPLAGVSHAHVSTIRREYGIDVGDQLTEEAMEALDGVLPEAYRLVIGDSAWMEKPVRRLRLATTIEEIAAATAGWGDGQGGGSDRVAALRVAELASEDAWPWADPDENARRQRARTIDTVDEVDAALRSRLCPQDEIGSLVRARRALQTLAAGRRLEGWHATQIAGENPGRKAIVDACAMPPAKPSPKVVQPVGTRSGADNTAIEILRSQALTAEEAEAAAKRLEPADFDDLSWEWPDLDPVAADALEAELHQRELWVMCPAPHCGDVGGGGYLALGLCRNCHSEFDRAAEDERNAIRCMERLLRSGATIELSLSAAVRTVPLNTQALSVVRHVAVWRGTERTPAWLASPPPPPSSGESAALPDELREAVQTYLDAIGPDPDWEHP